MIQAVIFDLDGVLVTTDECHYQAWKKMAQEESLPFDRQVNRQLRGVSRMESLEIILREAGVTRTGEEKHLMAERKNQYYVELISKLDSGALLPGAMQTVNALKKAGIRVAIGSSSKNAHRILGQLGIASMFDAIADGNLIKHSKPAPDVFLLAAETLGIAAKDCLVVEDADAGVEAAINAGMMVLGVGAAKDNPQANLRAETLEGIDLLGWIQEQN